MNNRAGPTQDAMMNIERPLTAHGFASFRDQAQLSLLRSFGSIYQDFICPLASPEYADLSSFVTVALDQSWSRDALNAFTSYMIFARSADKRLEQPALELYQCAVFSLKEKVKHELRRTEVVSVLMAATFLGLLEGLGTGSACHVIAHFSLVAQFGQEYFLDSSWKGSFLPLKRILLEDVVYNLACMSMFCPISDSALNAIDWTDYRDTFSDPNSGQWPYQLSPHFGGNYEFYQLILEITHISRQTLSQALRTCYANTWLYQLDFLENRLQIYYKSAPARAAAMYVAKYQLYAVALRIFSLKVRSHDLLPSAPTVEQLVHQAKQILTENWLQENHNPALAWPLIILLCSCADLTTFELFTRYIEDIKPNFGRGHFHNLEAVQRRIRLSFEPKNKSSSTKGPDNLLLLLLKNGMLSAANGSTVMEC